MLTSRESCWRNSVRTTRRKRRGSLFDSIASLNDTSIDLTILSHGHHIVIIMHAYSFRMWFLTLAVTDNVLFEGDGRVMRMRVDIAHKRRAPWYVVPSPSRNRCFANSTLDLVLYTLRAVQDSEFLYSGLFGYHTPWCSLVPLSSRCATRSGDDGRGEPPERFSDGQFA